MTWDVTSPSSAPTGRATREVAPSFSSVLKDCSVTEGQDFVLRCSVQGAPVPRITWLLNGELHYPLPPGAMAPSVLSTLNHSELRYSRSLSRKHR